MARKKPERNIWQRLFDVGRKASYNRDAGYVLYGKHDELRTYAVPGGYETEPVVDPILKRWIDALMAFDDREHHDAAPLIKLLLESDIEMLPIVRDWLADLAWRHNIPQTESKTSSGSAGNWLGCCENSFCHRRHRDGRWSPRMT